MRNHGFSFLVVALLVSMPLAGRAQDEGPPTVLPAAAPPEADSSLEKLQAEIQQDEARHAQEIKALREQLSRDGDEAILAHERESVERERLVRIYGFADIGVRRNTTPKDGITASQFQSPLTFYLGRLNLYFDSHPDPDFRFLVETRFSLYPGGTTSGVNDYGQRIPNSTLVSDVSSPNPSASVNWGSIILERATLDWTRYAFFSVRVGLFLTPFGIYNVDHGTPTLISIGLPLYVSFGWIPMRQMGLQVFGSFPVERWELGYAATVANGQTDGILDSSDAKAYGGRLFFRRHGELRLLLGVSAIRTPHRWDREQFGMDATGAITYSRIRLVEYTSLTVGGDVSLDYGPLRVRSELVWYQQEYTPGKRDGAITGQGGLNPDERDVNWTTIVAYRWWKLEPYLESQFFHCSPTLYMGTNVWIPGVGLNLYLRPNVILKGGWLGPRFYRDGDPQNLAARQNFHTFNLLLTWAF